MILVTVISGSVFRSKVFKMFICKILLTYSHLVYTQPFTHPAISHMNARSLWSQVTLLPWRLLLLELFIIQMTWDHNGKSRAHVFQVCWFIPLRL